LLDELYSIRKMSTPQIAVELGVTYLTVWRWLREYEIPVRSRSEAVRLR
jgi:hypothetical protein